MDIEGNEIKRDVFHVEWDIEAASKGGYDFFMLKEIYEQPEVLTKTLKSRVDEDYNIKFEDIGLTKELLEDINKIYIVACGTAYNAGLIGKYILEKLTRIRVEVDIASEFRYRNPIVDDKTLVIVLSQSGETLDTFEALKESKKNGAKVLAVTNVVGSSISRESDSVVYTWAGPEIAVASTKAYTTQLIILYLIAVDYAQKIGKISSEDAKTMVKELFELEDKVAKVLSYEKDIESVIPNIINQNSMFYLGRGLDYLTAIEGSLKSKEISYIHSEAFPSGELKHGTIALIEDGVPVMINVTQDFLMDKSISNIKEVKARGAFVIAVAKEGTENIEDVCDKVFFIPKVSDDLACFLSIIVHQLFAYHLAVAKGNDVDKPRNLAKSVTVE